MTELKIYTKYFNEILKLNKLFEIRHKKIKENDIVKLIEITSSYVPTGRYIVFKAGKSEKINQVEEINYANKPSGTTKIISNEATQNGINVDFLNGKYFSKLNTWYDDFCWKYISSKDSYIIPIKEFIEIHKK